MIHLDRVFYDGKWNPLPSEEFAAEQVRMVDGQEWVIDGNYMSTMPIRLAAADTVVVMDVSTLAALRGVLQRWWVHRSGQHGDGVFVRVTPEFVRYVASFRRTMRPRVMAAIAEHAGHADVRVLRSRRAARRMLAAITDEAREGGPPR